MSLPYEQRIQEELLRFEADLEVHQLPDIFHYWSEKHIRPRLRGWGIDSVDQLFTRELARQCALGERARFLSIGSGNCDLEVKVARELVEAGHRDFSLECLELNHAMLERGRKLAQAEGVEEWLRFTAGDFNELQLVGTYQAILANQSLHHVTRLEALFEQVERGLSEGGRFVVSDMIGRNGHQRWPLALGWIWEFWRELPPSYRYNQKLKIYEDLYVDRDYSKVGFEGVRAEDILPLIVERFEFEFFFGFGNLIDPFVDRGFGPNFQVDREWDRAFIDRVASKDREAIEAGEIPPTHMLAVLCRKGLAIHTARNVSPELCLASRAKASRTLPEPVNAHEYSLTDEERRGELEFAVTQMAKQTVLEERVASLTKEVLDQSDWGVGLAEELKLAQERVVALQYEVAALQAWGAGLDREIETAQKVLTETRADLIARTEWGRRLDKDLEERTEWALDLQRQLVEAQESWVAKTVRRVRSVFQS